MTYACGRQFVKYMERFMPVLEMGLQQHQVRLSSIMFVGNGKLPAVSTLRGWLCCLHG